MTYCFIYWLVSGRPQEWRDALLIPVPKKGDLSIKAFRLFVNLRKAYDSVSRDAMWLILAKHGVPLIWLGPFMLTCRLRFLLMII